MWKRISFKWWLVGAIVLVGGLLVGSVALAQPGLLEGPPGLIAVRLSEEMGAIPQKILEPLSPEELVVSEPKPTGPSPIVQGPSDSPEYRCVVVVKPLEHGGGSTKPVCGRGRIEAVEGQSLESLYLIARFYDAPDYTTPLIEYYGQYPCSAGYSYGRPNLAEDGVDNRFASGKGFSTCNLITVYDLYDYSGPSYACGPDCSTFYALNDAVSSWKIAYR
ncbi:MAG TPA: hypothetical protein VNK89_11575 [Thermoflexus sp.]|nr:hypothetical protein [Thermoflexus sp.]